MRDKIRETAGYVGDGVGEEREQRERERERDEEKRDGTEEEEERDSRGPGRRRERRTQNTVTEHDGGRASHSQSHSPSHSPSPSHTVPGHGSSPSSGHLKQGRFHLPGFPPPSSRRLAPYGPVHGMRDPAPSPDAEASNPTSCPLRALFPLTASRVSSLQFHVPFPPYKFIMHLLASNVDTHTPPMLSTTDTLVLD